jgi:hypothetical protein
MYHVRPFFSDPSAQIFSLFGVRSVESAKMFVYSSFVHRGREGNADRCTKSNLGSPWIADITSTINARELWRSRHGGQGSHVHIISGGLRGYCRLTYKYEMDAMVNNGIHKAPPPWKCFQQPG